MGVITNELKLHNSSDEHTIAFKVKTTAPIRYCVRPNTGIIPAGKSIDVQILLNCTKDSPSISMKTKDKFQILSIIVTDPNIDPKSIWTNSPPSSITKHKLKAVFSLPNEQQTSSTSSSTTSTTSSSISNGSSDYKSNGTLFSEVNNNINSSNTTKDNDIDKTDNIPTINIQPPTTSSNLNSNNRNDSKSSKPELVKRNINSNNNTSQQPNDNETEKLRNQLKNLNDELEKIKKNNYNSSTSSEVTQTKQGFTQIQTLIVIFIIAILSFVIGKFI